jgi:hypothetical protein
MASRYANNPDRVARRLGGLIATHAPAEVIDETRRELAELTLAEYITKVVNQAPPFTSEQLARLTLLLNGGDTAAAS